VFHPYDGSFDASDAGTADTGPGDTGPADAGSCTPDPQTAADAPRTVLMAHPYGATGGDCGRNVEVLRLDSQGVLSQTGTQIEVDDCPKRIVFSPDGRLVIIASYNDHVAPHPMSVKVYRHDAAGSLTFVQKIDGLDGTAPEDIAFSHDGRKALVTDFDSQGGVHVLNVEPGCAVSYVTKILVWAPTSVAVLPGDDFAVTVGGQDPKDFAVLDLDTNTVAAHHDLFGGFVDAAYLALSPDGKGVLVPSGNPYSDVGNTLFVLKIDYSVAIPIPSVNAVLAGVNSPEGVLYSPDGTKAMVTNVEDNKATWYNVAADGKLTAGGSITGMSLADRVAMLSRGPNAGTVLVGALSDIHVLKFTPTGVQKLQKLSFGGGFDAMTGDVAIEP
jgi:DNA-binding beta-propeller fold protein YncE